MATKAPKKPARRPSDKSFMTRADSLAKTRMTKKAKAWAAALGMEDVKSVDDFEERIQSIAAEREKGMSEGERNSARLMQTQEELRETKKKLEQYKQAYGRYSQLYNDMKSDYEMLEAETEIKDAAREAGVIEMDYAMHRFRQHLASGEDAQFGEDPRGFFESLKKEPSISHIFEVSTTPAGPKPAKEELPQDPNAPADPAPDLPPQPEPTPADAGLAPQPGAGPKEAPEDVSGLSSPDFQRRTAEKYGFRPSM